MTAAPVRTPGLVIFDCDGVLVDTENIANERLAAWLTEAGHPVTFEHCRRHFSGRSMVAVQQEVEAAGVSLGADFVELVAETGIEVVPLGAVAAVSAAWPSP